MGDRRSSATAGRAVAVEAISAEATEVEIAGDDAAWAPVVSTERLQVCAEAALRYAPKQLRGRAVTIVLGDDAEVRALNARFRGMDKPTNVLSFPAPDRPGPLSQLGDVILARETIEREAADLGIAAGDHACHLCVHGILHLLGHDHDTDEAAMAMESLETSILRDLGIADPYGGDRAEEARNGAKK